MHGYRSSEQQLNTILDEELQTLASFILNSQSSNGDEQLSRLNTDTNISTNKAYQVFSTNKVLLNRSSNAPQDPISNIDGFSEQAFRGSRWRTFAIHNQHTYVIVAQSDKYRRKVTEEILLATIVPIVFSIPFIGLLVFYIIRKSLSPLRHLSNQLTNKHSEDLSIVQLTAPSKELIPVVNRLNELFNRLSGSFELESSCRLTLPMNFAHPLVFCLLLQTTSRRIFNKVV